MNAATDTPRTDAAVIPGEHDEFGLIECVPIDIARALERELAKAKLALSEMEREHREDMRQCAAEARREAETGDPYGTY